MHNVTHSATASSSESCPGSDGIAAEFDVENEESPSPWDGLTLREIDSVRSYLLQQDSLNLTEDLSSVEPMLNYIFLIDLHPPAKSDVMAHLYRSGPRPQRYARVVIYRCVSLLVWDRCIMNMEIRR